MKKKHRYFNPSCTSKEETSYKDNKYYYSDCLVILQVLEKTYRDLKDWRVRIIEQKVWGEWAGP